MFERFQKKKTSFHNVRVDSGSYMDMEVSTTGSINLNDNICTDLKLPKELKKKSSSQSSFSSPFLETTWTSLNIILFIIYMIFETFMPFYWSISNQIYDYPLTSMSIQLFFCVVLLFIYNIIKFRCCFNRHPIASSPTSSYNNQQNGNFSDMSSWANLFNSQRHKSRLINNEDIANSEEDMSDDNDGVIRVSFCKHFWGKFWLKTKLIIFPAAFFSLNMVVTTIGVSQGSMDIHILLKATEIIWFVILSPFLLTDYPTKSSVTSAVAITIGAICFSWSSIGQNDITFLIITCNLLSAIFEPFQILFLRRAARIITVEGSETRMMDGIDLMTKAEMTLIYLFYALIIILPFQLIFEGIFAIFIIFFPHYLHLFFPHF